MIALEQPRPPKTFSTILMLVEWHLHLRPKMQIQDVYKLLYQALLGNEHAAAKMPAAQERLDQEIAAIDKNATEELLVEPIHPENALVRINLRPFVRAMYDTRRLAEIFCQNSSSNGTSDFHQYWSEICSNKQILESLVESSESIDSFISYANQNNYPVLHHSEPYRINYKPAYRVVRFHEFQLAFKDRREVS